MALSTKTVYLNAKVNSDYAPAGHATALVPSSLGTVDVTENIDFSLTASGIVNSNKVTAFAALEAALIVAIDAYIAAVDPGLGIDLTTNTVSYNAQVNNITRGTNGLSNDELLPAANDAFIVRTNLRVYNS